MFTLDSQGVYRCDAFSRVPGLLHGFGTRVSERWPNGRPVAGLRQIHSDRVIVAGEGEEGDALITDRPSLLLTIRTADCIPILLVDTRVRTIGAVHAGWRGTASEIAPKAVLAMASQFGTNPADLLAAIGPGIGECCYEVGTEVSGRLQKYFPERRDWGSRARVDLGEANRRQLAAAGVSNIYRLEKCTKCEAAQFHSYRRDGEAAGRMISGIGFDY